MTIVLQQEHTTKLKKRKSATMASRASLSFQSLSYTVPVKASKEKPAHDKQILKGISGIARPGEVFAILGSSGFVS